MMFLSIGVHNFDIEDRYEWSTPLIRILLLGGSAVCVLGAIRYFILSI